MIHALVDKFPNASDNDEIKSIKDEIVEMFDSIKIEEEGEEEAEEEPAVRENLPPLKKKRSKSRKKIRRPYNKTKIKGNSGH